MSSDNKKNTLSVFSVLREVASFLHGNIFGISKVVLIPILFVTLVDIIAEHLPENVYVRAVSSLLQVLLWGLVVSVVAVSVHRMVILGERLQFSFLAGASGLVFIFFLVSALLFDMLDALVVLYFKKGYSALVETDAIFYISHEHFLIVGCLLTAASLYISLRFLLVFPHIATRNSDELRASSEESYFRSYLSLVRFGLSIGNGYLWKLTGMFSILVLLSVGIVVAIEGLDGSIEPLLGAIWLLDSRLLYLLFNTIGVFFILIGATAISFCYVRILDSNDAAKAVE